MICGKLSHSQNSSKLSNSRYKLFQFRAPNTESQLAVFHSSSYLIHRDLFAIRTMTSQEMLDSASLSNTFGSTNEIYDCNSRILTKIKMVRKFPKNLFYDFEPLRIYEEEEEIYRGINLNFSICNDYHINCTKSRKYVHNLNTT